MNHIVLDFETYYTPSYSLSQMSTQEYVRDPRFQVIGAAVRWPNETRSTWYVDDELARAMREIKRYEQDLYCISHNSNFDGVVLSLHYGINPGHLGCTLGMASALGLVLACGGSLARLTEVFQRAGYPLRSKGNEVVAALGKRREDFTDAELAAYGVYSCTDNDNCHTFADAFIPLLPPDELLWQSQVLKMHTTPRMRVDAAMVASEADRVRVKRQAALDKLRLRLGLTYLDDELLRKLVVSRPKLSEILDGLGVLVPTKTSPATGKPTPALSKKDPQFLALLNHPDDMVRAVVEARLELASSIEKSRCEQFARLAKMPAFSAPYKISGAHTHRLGGSDGINLQNMTSGRKAGQSDALKRSIVPLDPSEVFVGADSSQIEVRVLDYVADDWSGLEDFRKGVCPYSRMGTKMWPTEGIDAAEVKRLAKIGDELWAMRRQIAKAVVLACLAADTLVLTRRGPVPIVDVGPADLVWDGIAWVGTMGCQYMGDRAVIERCGITLTPDHKVLVGDGWIEAESADELEMVNTGRRNLPHPVYCERHGLHRAGSEPGGAAGRAQDDAARWPAQEPHDAGGVGQARGSAVRVHGDRASTEGQAATVRTGARDLVAVSAAWIQADEPPPAGAVALDRCEAARRGGQSPQPGGPRRGEGGVADVGQVGTRDGDDAPHRPGKHGQASEQPPARAAAQGGCGAGAGRAVAAGSSACSDGSAACGGDEAAHAYLGGEEQAVHHRHDQRRDLAEHDGSQRGDGSVDGEPQPSGVGKATAAAGVQLRPVYDLIECGPRNRFAVVTRDGNVVIVHNCGFGQGGAGFKVYAETQAGLIFTDEEALSYVKQYREAKPRVVQFWRQCDRVLQALINGQHGEFGGPDGKLLHFDGARRVLGVHLPGIRLPNGTWLSYPNIRNTTVRELNEETGEYEDRKVVVYDNAKGRAIEQRYTWGGTCCENIVQALAFAVMKWQAGEPVFLQHGLVLNCHDAHATIAPRAQAEQVKQAVLAALSQCPPWAPGIPLGAEADISETMAGVI